MGNPQERGEHQEAPAWLQPRQHKYLMLPERASVIPSALVLARESSNLSPRQQERLRAFQNIVGRVNDQQTKLDNGEKRKFLLLDAQGNVQTDEKGNQIEVAITQDMVATWRQTAFHMYEAFSADPHMKEAAGGFMTLLHENREQETRRLNALWDTTEGEIF